MPAGAPEPITEPEAEPASRRPGVRKRGYSMDAEEYQARLRRIEGQVRGLQRLIAEDAYCIDVLTQISAVQSALQAVAVGLLDQHLRHCVAHGDDVDGRITEAMAAIERLLRR